MTVHYLDTLSESIERDWNLPALTDYSVLDGGPGNSYTYGGMYSRMESLRRFFDLIGLKRGDHIAICGANSANWVVAYLSVAAFGGVAVTILHSQVPQEIARQISFSDSVALFADTAVWESVSGSGLSSLKCVLALEDFSTLSPSPRPSLPPMKVEEMLKVDIRHGGLDDPAQICFTSGTTLKAKAVMLSYRNLSNNVTVGEGISPIGPEENVVSLLPYSHVFGLVFEVLDHLTNSSHIFILGSRPSVSLMLSSFQRVQPCLLRFVPLLIESLYDRLGEGLADIFGDNLHQLFIGGASLREDVEDALKAFGIPYVVGYGSTETSPLISVSRLDEYKPHTAGKIVPGMEARISEKGEIMVRGENVMLGYYRDPEATMRKIDLDGWLHTGDRGLLDDEGNLYVQGRIDDDMIVLPSGENIHPRTIEALLDGLDGVKESLVLERSGHLAALAYAPGRSSSDELLSEINALLPSYSQLDELEFVSEPFHRTSKLSIERHLYK